MTNGNTATKKKSARTRRQTRKTPQKKKGGLKWADYTSTRGKKVRFVPMPPLLLARIEEQVDDQFGKLTIPTYEVETATGVNQTIEHTEKTITTEKDKLAWAEYVTLRDRRAEEISTRTLRALQIECCIPIIEEDDDWVERHEFMGMTVPDGKYDRHLYWIEAEFLGGEEDMMACVTIPMELSGVDQEDMAAAERLFRNPV